MTAIFELPLPSETLNPDEIVEITGAKTCDGQRSWLDTNRCDVPVYRLVLCGRATSQVIFERAES